MFGWVKALARTRDTLAGALGRVLGRGPRVAPEDLDDLESALLQADVPVRLVQDWIDDLRRSTPRGESPRAVLRRDLREALGPAQPFPWPAAPRPFCILAVGINGSGKTTTCAKLARMALGRGLSPLLGAADTYRAAGSDQLRLWAQRVPCEVVAGRTGADAAAVAFDAVEAAVARQADFLVVDTAGRMHTKQPLMHELQKVHRAMAKRLAGAPHEVWMVLDASMGQNALAQTRTFAAAVPVTGLVVTKLDGSSKAGFLFGIQRELGLPVRFVGLGESADDLAPFDPEAFLDGMIGAESA